jgi:hypothetical protein
MRCFRLEYEVEFADPGPCFLKQTKLSHTSVARFKGRFPVPSCRSRPRSPCLQHDMPGIVAIPEFMEVPLLWLAEGAITGLLFSILTHKSADHCRYRSLRINRALPPAQLNVLESTRQKVLTWAKPLSLAG